MWNSVEEVWNVRLEGDDYHRVNKAGRALTTALRHGDHWWCPPRDMFDKSLSSITAMNMLIIKKLVPPGTTPASLYTYCKLFK